MMTAAGRSAQARGRRRNQVPALVNPAPDCRPNWNRIPVGKRQCIPHFKSGVTLTPASHVNGQPCQ